MEVIYPCFYRDGIDFLIFIQMSQIIVQFPEWFGILISHMLYLFEVITTGFIDTFLVLSP